MALPGSRVGLGVLDHSRGQIDGDDARAKLGHATGELAVAARDIQHDLTGRQIEQTLLCRSDEKAVKSLPSPMRSIQKSAFASQVSRTASFSV